MKFRFDLSQEVADFIEKTFFDDIKIGYGNIDIIKVMKGRKNYYLKMAVMGSITMEYKVLKWLNDKLKVPKIVKYDTTPGYESLITKELVGENLTSRIYVTNIDNALVIIKEAFDSLYAVDITNCPFKYTNDYMLDIVKERVAKNLVKDSDLSDDTKEKFGSVQNVLKYLIDNKFEEEFCLSHGDLCLENIIGLDDTLSGFVDLDECGVRDKWYDIAVCLKSIRKVYGNETVLKFYETLNITPDQKKIEYYLLMLELYK